MLSRLGIALTSRCNLSCTHCLQISHPTEDLPPPLFMNILEAAQDYGIQNIALTGGEPTVHPQFLEIVKMISHHGFTYSLTTNGISRKKILRACMILPPSHITFSFEGPSPDLHDEIRGIGSFYRTHRTMQLVRYAKVPFQIQSTLTRAILGVLDEMIQFAEDNGSFRLMLALPLPNEGLVLSNNYPMYNELVVAKRCIINDHDRHDRDFQVKIALDQYHLLCPGEPRFVTCPFLEMQEIFINSRCELTLCCQMSGFGSGDQDIVADLRKESFSGAHIKLVERIADLQKQRILRLSRTPMRRLDYFACLSCAEMLGKLRYLEGIKCSSWTNWSEIFMCEECKNPNRRKR